MLAVRDVIEEMDPLATARLDDYLDPSVLEVALNDGLCDADEARIDIQWTTHDEYKFHCSDTAGMNPRRGKHPHGGDCSYVSGERYHSLPDASSVPDDVEDYCITQFPEELVTRVVLNSGESPTTRAQIHRQTLGKSSLTKTSDLSLLLLPLLEQRWCDSAD